MKVTFQGEARVHKAGKTGGGSATSTRREVRALRKELRKELRRMRRAMRKTRRDLRRGIRREVRRELRRSVRRDIRREIYSNRFARFLRAAIGGGAPIREVAEGLLNEAVRVETTAGPVSGTLIEVGTDYMVIRETPTTTLIVPFRHVEAIQPL